MDISAVRESLEAAIVAGGIPTVYTFVPERPIPNCAIIEPDTEFMTVYEGQYGAYYQSNWRVQVIVQFGANSRETATLDSYLDALIPQIWQETSATRLSVDRPFILDVNNAGYLATNINISIDME
jgi:hypothetical protein